MISAQQIRSPVRRSSIALLLAAAILAIVVDVVDAASLRSVYNLAAAARHHQSPFLYAGNSYPVIEYMEPPPSRSSKSSSGSGSSSSSDSDSSDEPDEPDFLYSTSNRGYRLVQFYVKTGAASFTVREKYIATAAAVLDIVQRHNVTAFETYAVSCTAAPALCEVQGMSILDTSGGTAFVLYPPGSTDGIRLDNLSATLILEKMGIDVNNGNSLTSDERLRVEQAEAVTVSAALDDSAVHAMRTLDDLKNDIHLSFDIAMRHHVYNRDAAVANDDGDEPMPLSPERKAALKSWFLLIHKTLPPSWPIHSTVKELINSFMYVSKNEAYMLSILDSSKPASTDFSPSCRHDAQSLAGSQVSHHTTEVTCGTWELFHAVTVGVVEYNKLSLAEKRASHIAPEAAATIIRDYVFQFGMDGDNDTASRHFLPMANACLAKHCLKPPKPTRSFFSFDRSSAATANATSSSSSPPVVEDWIRLPIWMSQVHTDINVLVQAEKSAYSSSGRRRATLQQHMDAAWPPHNYCPSCWNAVTGQWNVDAVYRYLQLEYTQIEDISPAVRYELFRMPLPRRFVETNDGQLPTMDLLQSSILLFAAAVLVLRVLSVRGRILVTPKSD